MYATFIELPCFAKIRENYLDDDEYFDLQEYLIVNPKAGDLIQGTNGLRKIRFADKRRGKGKRGGLRIIYYWWTQEYKFYLFTIYNKDEMNYLNAQQKVALKKLVEELVKPGEFK